MIYNGEEQECEILVYAQVIEHLLLALKMSDDEDL